MNGVSNLQLVINCIRNRVNEQSTDVGALLDDAGNLLDFANEGIEQAVLDLAGTYPNELLTYEDVSMAAHTKTYTLTKDFWQILKISKTVAGENETEMDVVDPLSHQYVEVHDEENEKPFGANIIAGVLYVYPTPSAAIANYIRIWGIIPMLLGLQSRGQDDRGEAGSMDRTLRQQACSDQENADRKIPVCPTFCARVRNRTDHQGHKRKSILRYRLAVREA
jgi:hypothetical protein